MLDCGKCMGGEVTFLGHKVDFTGLHPVSEKVRAIENSPTSNVTELKDNLGLLNYSTFCLTWQLF